MLPAMAPSLDGLELFVRPDEQCVALTAGFRLIQRYRGHRTSVDDMLVAHLACALAPRPSRVLDLGCGLGSALLMVAWAAPDAELVGLEAQPEHVALARRNLLLNGCEGRARVVEGDLREAAAFDGLGAFDLVLGTPPYFDPRSGTLCADPQRAAAQWELRGGIEAYAAAAAHGLAPSGLFVACAGARPEGRALEAFAAAGLGMRFVRPVVPKAGKPPFLLLLAASPGVCEAPGSAPPLVLRLEDGRRSPEHVEIRERFGVPASPF